MKKIANYIQEKLNLSTYTCKPKNKKELEKILEERIKQDKDTNLNDIDISDIKDMSFLFFGLDPHDIDISEWDVSNVIDMQYMFSNCKNFNSDLSEWDVSNVINMKFMFANCKKFNCDLSDWNVSNIEDMYYMFTGCTSLKNKPSWYKDEKTK